MAGLDILRFCWRQARKQHFLTRRLRRRLCRVRRAANSGRSNGRGGGPDQRMMWTLGRCRWRCLRLALAAAHRARFNRAPQKRKRACALVPLGAHTNAMQDRRLRSTRYQKMHIKITTPHLVSVAGVQIGEITVSTDTVQQLCHSSNLQFQKYQGTKV